MKFDIDARPIVPATTLPRARANALPKNPERIAWLVIAGAFTLCLGLAISVPLGARYFLLYSQEAQPGTVQAISPSQDGGGTISLTPPNATLPIAVKGDPMPLTEGSWIETDQTQTSNAFLTLFEGSTVRVFPDSRLFVSEMRRPRFSWGESPDTVVIDQARGVVRYAAAMPYEQPGNPSGRASEFLVHTPQFDASLSEGSYSIEVNNNDSQVLVREGSALVRSPAGDHEVTVGQGQRVQVFSDQPWPTPVPAAQDLIADGDFSSNQLPASWQAYSDQGGDAGNINGSIGIDTAGDRRAVQILRSGAGQNSAITGIRQQIDKDVSDFRSLVFSADVRLHYQSLSGGGYLSTEYPLIVRLVYRDVDGNEWDYVHGFYYQNDSHNPTKNGELLPQDQWVPFETSNLMEQLDPKPFRILYIEIYASGWDYESYISGVKLTVE